jgi:hypothetical protein
VNGGVGRTALIASLISGRCKAALDAGLIDAEAACRAAPVLVMVQAHPSTVLVRQFLLTQFRHVLWLFTKDGATSAKEVSASTIIFLIASLQCLLR